MLETSRLVLRKFSFDDLDELTALRADPLVMKYIGEQSREKVLERLRFYISCYESHGFGMCGASFKGESALIGWSGLQPLENSGEVEIGYGFAKPHWGKGLASEAGAAWLKYGFEHVGLERIVAVALPENIASRRVMEKLGMKYEKNSMHYGFDCAYYAISRDEFRPDENSFYALRD